jgi:short-subunit dehydrogenase involved in D-alanine esterification of teichoic acids
VLFTDRCLHTLYVFVTRLQVNNAGVNFNKGPDNSVEFAEQVIETNYYGTKRMIDAMISLMVLG